MAYVNSGYWNSGYANGDGGVVQNTYGIRGDVQTYEPGSIISLFELDLSALPGGPGEPLYFCPAGPNSLGASVVWQGITYQSFPIEATGFEWTGKGPIPRPTIRASNIAGSITYLLLNYQDMVGAKVVRRRTLVKYLDAVNFSGGNTSADPTAHFPDDIFYIKRKVRENKQMVELELGSSMDVQGIMIPLRQIIANVCTWQYRSTECGYAGGAVAKVDDTPTADINLDSCGKRLTSCKKRFGDHGQLPTSAFPSAGLTGR